MTDHAATIWLSIERIHAAGFDVALEHKNGRAIARATPTIIRVDRPVTVKYADGLVYERDSLRDAVSQLLTVLVGQIELDAEERRGKWEVMDAEDHAALLSDTAAATHHERDSRAAE